MVLPEGAPGVDPPRHLELGRVELEDGQVGEDVAVRVEEAIVVDAARLTENPLAVGPQVGLRRPALDLVAVGVLALVERGKVSVFEHEHSRAEHSRRNEHGHGDPVQADARRFDSRDLVGPGEQAEADQGRHQNA